MICLRISKEKNGTFTALGRDAVLLKMHLLIRLHCCLGSGRILYWRFSGEMFILSIKGCIGVESALSIYVARARTGLNQPTSL